MFTLRNLSALTLVIAAVGCGTTIRDVQPAVGGATPLPEALARIHVTDTDIETPHRELAVVRTAAYRREALEIEGTAELRRQAARIGANAVIHVHALPELTEEVSYRPGSLLRSGTQWVTLYRLRGVAVLCETEVPPAQTENPSESLELNLPQM